MPVIKTGTSLTTKPTLNLDFARDKQLDPRITFTRGSNGTYYDGYTSVKAEENLLTDSQTLQILPSTNVDRTGNATTAPDGTTTATSVTIQSGQTTGANIRYTSVPVIAEDYVFSVFAKPNGKNYLNIRELLSNGNNNDTWFNVSTGAVGTTDADHTATITDVGNGWYRCSIKFSVNASRSTNIIMFIADTDNSTTVADDGNGLYLWGAQLEQKDSLTAYTPTTSSPIIKYQLALQTAGNNVARFDHDPVTGESLGLLIEDQRTNIIPTNNPAQSTSDRFSSDFNTTDVVAPDGTQTGVLKAYWDGSETSPGGAKYMFFRDAAFTTTNIHTSSVYVYPVAETNLRMTPHSQYASDTDGGTAAGGNAYFDCTGDGSVISFDGATIDAKIKNVGGGWYRISATYYRNSTNPITSSYGVIIYSNSTVGSGAGELEFTGYYKALWYMWGPQVEEGTFPTSYIKTTSSQVTRSEDSAVMTGDNFSSWYRQGQGTVYLDYRTGEKTSGFRIAALSSGSNANRMEFAIASGGGYGPYAFFVTNNVNQVASSGGYIYTSNTNYKSATGFKLNDTSFSNNGESTINDTSCIIPIVDRFYIGADATGAAKPNATIRKVSFYPKRLTNNELQILTSGDVDELNNAKSLSLQILDSSGNVIKSIYN